MEKDITRSAAICALEFAPFGVLMLDQHDHITFINKTLSTIFKLDNSPAFGTPTSALPSTLLDAIKGDRSFLEVPTTANERPQSIKYWVHPLENSDGGSVHFFLDVSEHTAAYQERDRLKDELARLSTRDNLTGLPNRMALLQGLEPLISRSRRYNNPLSIVRLKLEHPDKLDADHGAECGSEAFVRVSQLLRDQMRWADLVGRLDEDEFMLILPETPGDAATRLSEKLQAKIADLEIAGRGNGNAFRLISRFGTASWSKGDDAARLLKNAAPKMDRSNNSTAA